MIPDSYVWFAWAGLFLIPWLALFAAFPAHRGAMGWASVFTAPLGLSEPLFVPRYWNPPSLFDLAQNTRFDIESIIFCFGIGGTGAVLYNIFTGQAPRPIEASEKRSPLHRHHYKALASPFIAFLATAWLPWNPIYPAILAMFVGAIATMLCRPDLKAKTWIGGVLFLGYYAFFLIGLKFSAPGYIEQVWNLDDLSGIRPFGLPVEELLFGFTVGLYWSGVYEHFMWMKPQKGGM